ncbi:hypothetical protein [Streptomyces winkii]|uniref:hypothetical protein n=1 Tax=Streptomyces winkii TaxID=3051178 RepID=UPI0028D1EFF6|nr:hypothetical protein [Streptomyces sp. DSM 40971]
MGDDARPPDAGQRADGAAAAQDGGDGTVRQWRRHQLLALSGAAAASTALTGLATNVWHVPAGLWFLCFAALVLAAKRRLRRMSVAVTPSWRVLWLVIGAWAVSLGLTVELAPGRWWIWPAAAGVQLAAGAVGTWWTER